MAAGEVIIDVNADTGKLEGSLKGIGNIFKSTLGSLVSFAGIEKIFGSISESVDAAMGRIDTMDRFSRTLTTMTGSADLADEALQNITDTVTGTAYGLDVAARAVQGFITSGMEIDTATDQFATLADAVSFYGDGTNGALESVMEAWNKMATAGKVAAVDVRTLTLAGIPAYRMYAEAVGQSVEEAQAALSSGEVSAAQFQQVLTSAMQSGSASFQSVSGAAQAAGQSWAGAMDNAKAATARGMQAIISAFDGMFNVKSGMVSAGKAIEKAMKGVAKNLDILIPIIGIATGAFIAYKAAINIQALIRKMAAAQMDMVLATSASSAATIAETAAKSGQTVAMTAQATIIKLLSAGKKEEAATTIAATLANGQLTLSQVTQTLATAAQTGATTTATAAQLGLNAAMKANPIGWVIGLVAALVAAITALAIYMNRVSEEGQAMLDSADAQIEKNQQLTESIEEQNTAYEEKLNSARDEISVMDDLTAKISALASEESRSAEQKSSLAAYVRQYNEVMGESVLYYDQEADALSAVSGEYDNVVDAMEKATEARRKQMLVDIALEREAELLKQKAAAEREANAAIDEATELRTRSNALMGEAEAMRDRMNKGIWQEGDSLDRAGKLANEANQLYERSNELIEAGAQSRIDAADTETEYAAAVKETNGIVKENIALAGDEIKVLEDLAEKHGTAVDVIEEGWRKSGLSIEDYGAALDAQLQQEEERLKRHQDIMGARASAAEESNNRIEKSDQTSLAAKVENREHNIGVVEQMVDDMDYLYGKIPESVYTHLEDAGASEARAISEMRADMEAGGGEVAQAYVESYEAAMALGLTDSTALAEGVTTNVEGAKDAQIEAIEGGGFEEGGELVDSKTAEGLEKGAGEVENAATETIKGAESAARTTAYSADWQGIGLHMTSGMATGVRRGVGILQSAMAYVVSSALRAAQSAAVIQSPSKLFDKQVGFMLSAGIAQGIDRGTPMVEKSLGQQITALAKDVGKMPASIANIGVAVVNDGIKQNMVLGNSSASLASQNGVLKEMLQAQQALLNKNWGISVDGRQLATATNAANANMGVSVARGVFGGLY